MRFVRGCFAGLPEVFSVKRLPSPPLEFGKAFVCFVRENASVIGLALAIVLMVM